MLRMRSCADYFRVDDATLFRVWEMAIPSLRLNRMFYRMRTSFIDESGACLPWNELQPECGCRASLVLEDKAGRIAWLRSAMIRTGSSCGKAPPTSDSFIADGAHCISYRFARQELQIVPGSRQANDPPRKAAMQKCLDIYERWPDASLKGHTPKPSPCSHGHKAIPDCQDNHGKILRRYHTDRNYAQ